MTKGVSLMLGFTRDEGLLLSGPLMSDPARLEKFK